MKAVKTEIPGPIIIEPHIFEDERGYFYESYNKEKFKNLGIDNVFVQDNDSYSSYGVLRGLHYQTGEFCQAKLIRVIEGKVKDIVVDIRDNSPNYGKHVSVILSQENKKMFFIPRGFAHGFVVLSEHALFNYKCDNLFMKQSEGQINPLSEELNLDWGIPKKDFILSQKDKEGPEIGKHIPVDISF